MQAHFLLSSKMHAISCPVCQEVGQALEKITVQNQVTNINLINESDQAFFLCLTPDCQVAYFTETNSVIYMEELKNKLWFKNIESPTPCCYCANVTEEEILYHVAEAKCCDSLEDIQRHTGANTGCNCLTQSPTGN